MQIETKATRRETMEEQELERLRKAVGTPPGSKLSESGRRIETWFAQTAPLIRWDVLKSPLGPLYVASSDRGVRHVEFGVSQMEFLSLLDPLARTEQNRSALAPMVEQFDAYFAGTLTQFDLPLDLEQLTPFQRSVLQTARRIATGTVWTYGQVARALGKPRASQAVGQAPVSYTHLTLPTTPYV